MYNSNINTQVNGTGSISGMTVDRALDQAEMEKTILSSIVGDYDQQLSQISQGMKDILAQKNQLRQDISELTTLKQEPLSHYQGQEGIIISAAQAEKLSSQEGLIQIPGAAGGSNSYFIPKDKIEKILGDSIDAKQQTLSSINANSELTMMQVQSLVGQRQNAMMMLSNMLANNAQTQRSIIGNFKS